MRKVKKIVKKIVPKTQEHSEHGEQEFEELDVETEVDETDSNQSDDEQDQNQNFYKEKSIAFEDEKFQEEKGETLLPFSQFQPFLEDFITENHNFVIIDSTGELQNTYQNQNNDIRSENKYNDSTETDPLKRNLLDSIAMYERMLEEDSFNTDEERNAANTIVATLKKQLKDYEQRRTNTQTMKGSKAAPPPTKDELRIKGLKEIFHFYARQHIPHGIAFEQLEVIMNQVDLGEFTSFCKDFEIPISRVQVTRCFKQCSNNNKPLEFEHFYKGILRLGVELNKVKIDEVSKKLSKMPPAPKKSLAKSKSSKKDDKKDDKGKPTLFYKSSLESGDESDGSKSSKSSGSGSDSEDENSKKDDKKSKKAKDGTLYGIYN